MSNSYEQELITLPLGEAQFVALTNMVKKNQTDEEASVYAVRVHYDGSNPAAQEAKKKLEAVNPRIIGSKNAKSAGDFTVQATTKFQPKIFAPDGEELTGEDIPRFSKGSTAKVTMTVKPYTGKMGSGIKLIAVQFHELNIVESSGGEEARQNTMNKLRESLSAAAKL